MIYIREDMEITDIYRIYIGSDNKTNKINKEYIKTIKGILDLYNLNYTLINTHGYWNYTQEDSIIIEVIDIGHNDIIYSVIKTIANKLKVELKQMTILITKQCIKYEVI